MAYAWLISAQAVGGVVGGIALGRFGRHIAPALLFGSGALLLGVIDLLIFYAPLYAPMVTPALLLPVVLMVLVGGPSAAITAGYMTPAQTAVGDAFLRGPASPIRAGRSSADAVRAQAAAWRRCRGSCNIRPLAVCARRRCNPDNRGGET